MVSKLVLAAAAVVLLMAGDAFGPSALVQTSLVFFDLGSTSGGG